MSRGGREGNNALLKDVNDLFADDKNIAKSLMEWDSPMTVVKEALALKIVNSYEVIHNQRLL